jgi:tripartite-type tricarboxylate transporter receptor subunit TctC
MAMHSLACARSARTLAIIGAVVAPAMFGSAWAQSWPSKTIKVIVPIGAGSAADIVPRIVFEHVSRKLGQPIVVENRPGAGGTIGAAAVAKADPDGYTLLAMSSSYTIAPAVYKSLAYDAELDLQPVILLGSIPNVLVAAPSKGFRTLQDLIAAAKAKPGVMNYASVGNGTTPSTPAKLQSQSHLGTCES